LAPFAVRAALVLGTESVRLGNVARSARVVELNKLATAKTNSAMLATTTAIRVLFGEGGETRCEFGASERKATTAGGGLEAARCLLGGSGQRDGTRNAAAPAELKGGPGPRDAPAPREEG
jgi:hypothetical protein